MVDNSVEEWPGPLGPFCRIAPKPLASCPVESLQIASFSLSICPAFGHLFSEKLSGHKKIQVDGVNFHIQPELGALRFNDVNISSVDGPDTARGRLPILLYLVRYEHSLFNGSCEACLPGKSGDEVSDPVVSAGV